MFHLQHASLDKHVLDALGVATEEANRVALGVPEVTVDNECPAGLGIRRRGCAFEVDQVLLLMLISQRAGRL